MQIQSGIEAYLSLWLLSWCRVLLLRDGNGTVRDKIIWDVSCGALINPIKVRFDLPRLRNGDLGEGGNQSLELGIERRF